MANIGKERGEANLQRLEIERASAFMDLDGIAAAHGDVRLSFAGEVREVVLNTNATLWIAFGLNGLKPTGPDIAGEQAAVKGGLSSGEEFQGFGNFERSNETDDRAKHADSVAGFFEASTGGGIEKTSEAGRFAGQNGHGEAVTGDGGSVDPGSVGFDGEVVDEEAGLEVVGAVED